MGGVADRGLDDDGHEIHGGIRLIRDAFVQAAGGKLTCLEATMTYAEGNAQMLTFSGIRRDDGSPFSASFAVPAGAPLGSYVKRAARTIIDPPEEG